MAGSQLKKLKAELKANGLIGQTNVKKKNKKGKNPVDARRDDKKQILGNIREKFNVFDSRINRVKRDVTVIKEGKFVTAGKESAKPTKSNSFLNKNLKLAYEAMKKTKGRNSKLVDRRFGESNKELSSEEKMLERFTRERERSSKASKFSLESDDEYEDDGFDGEFQLTHSGKVLADEDVEDTKAYVDEDSLQPERKKTKNEVMKEVIAKSKFYKAERQKLFNKTQAEIDELDGDFSSVMGGIHDYLHSVDSKSKDPKAGKTPEQLEYDAQVRALAFEKRSVPADRTKTQEELSTEYNEKMKKLEADRMKRMEGERDAEGDDIDDDFWEGSENENDSSVDETQDGEGEASAAMALRRLKTVVVSMPTDLEEFEQSISDKDTLEYVNAIIKHYKPHLAEGNKEKMNIFVGILFEYVSNFKGDTNEFNELVKVLKKLSEAYNERLVEVLRGRISEMEQRIESKSIVRSDFVYLTLCGLIFSTSDKYHLIIVPNLILMNKLLTIFVSQEVGHNNNIELIGQSIFIIDLLLQYQRISKRFDPEIVNSINKIFAALLANPKTVRSEASQQEEIALSELFGKTTDNIFKVKLLNKLTNIVDKMNGLWKEYSVLVEINAIVSKWLGIMIERGIGDLERIKQVQDRISKLSNIAVKERRPLALQQHKRLAIKTFQPKFEENFNPDKKSYDLDLERSEINKIKSQLKKEKKATVKDIRRQNKFEANEKIKEKVKMYDEYHSKMAKIVNSISTVEGHERNEYEKEKRRANRK